MGRMLRIENNASLIGIKYPMRKVFKEADKIYARHGQELVLTCGSNGEHSPASYHPFGYAVDLRTNFFGEDQAVVVANELREVLGMFYDVVLHTTHMHVEFDVARYMKHHDLNNDPMFKIFC